MRVVGLFFSNLPRLKLWNLSFSWCAATKGFVQFFLFLVFIFLIWGGPLGSAWFSDQPMIWRKVMLKRLKFIRLCLLMCV